MHSTWGTQTAYPRSGMETPWALRKNSSYPLVLVSPLISSLIFLAARVHHEACLSGEPVLRKLGLIVSLFQKCGAMSINPNSINHDLTWFGPARRSQIRCYPSAQCVLQSHTGTAECIPLRIDLASIRTGGKSGNHEPDMRRVGTREMVLYCFLYQLSLLG